MGEFLSEIHPVLAFALVAVLVVVPTVAVAIWAMRRQDPDDRSNDAVVTAGARVIGVFFAILAAFLLVSTYGDYSDARTTAHQERAALETFLIDARDLDALPPRTVTELEVLAEEYLRVVANVELDLLGEDFSHVRADQIVDQLARVSERGAKATGTNDSSEFDQVLTQLNAFTELRLERLLAGDILIPSVLWAVVLGSAAMLLATMAVFPRGRDTALKMLQTVSTALVVSFIIVALLELEDPYHGAIRISADVYAPLEREEAAVSRVGRD